MAVGLGAPHRIVRREAMSRSGTMHIRLKNNLVKNVYFLESGADAINISGLLV